MNIFFWDKNIYQIGKVNSEFEKNLEVLLPSGIKKKISKTKTSFVLFDENIDNFISETETFLRSINIDDVWKVAPKGDFTVCDLNNIFFSKGRNSVSKAALLMCIVKNPIYFKKKSNGFFCSTPLSIIRKAISSQKLREKKIEEEKLLVNQILQGELPNKIKEYGKKLLLDPEKHSIEYRALKKASKNLGLSSAEILYNFGIIKSAFEYHKLMFLSRLEKLHLKDKKLSSKKNLDDLFENHHLSTAKIEAYSIDDIFTTEIDDAFSLQVLNENIIKWRVGVHIALPVKFLTPAECEELGVNEQALSIYTPSEKKTMFSKRLLQEASLNENTVKPVLSLYIDFDENGFIVYESTILEKIFIKQNIRLGDWEKNFEKDPLTDELPWDGLKDLYFLAKILSKRRGTLKINKYQKKEDLKLTVLGRNKRTFENFDIGGAPVIESRKRGSFADMIVSEFMILTNHKWAKILRNFPKPAIYRTNSSGLTRMQTSFLPHEELGIDVYAWTTSPLRRYVDFLNQWQLITLIIPGKSSNSMDKETIDAAIKNHEKKSLFYNEFQKFMEKYWMYRWLILKKNKTGEFWKKTESNKFFLTGTHLGNGKFCLVDIPLNFYLDNFEGIQTGENVKLEIKSINCLDMKVELCFRE
ncbi:MAG: hypothetical protein CBC01_05400 [Betaproteobacteria bacterium TMED41]|nr:MAG: hypothetical protein CBC01_05400 [Betaproteobacteria bacterium TMED41]